MSFIRRERTQSTFQVKSIHLHQLNIYFFTGNERKTLYWLTKQHHQKGTDITGIQLDSNLSEQKPSPSNKMRQKCKTLFQKNSLKFSLSSTKNNSLNEKFKKHKHEDFASSLLLLSILGLSFEVALTCRKLEREAFLGDSHVC